MDIIIPIIIGFLIALGIGFILLVVWASCMIAGAADRAMEEKMNKELEDKKDR